MSVYLNEQVVGNNMYPNGERIFKDLLIYANKSNIIRVNYTCSADFETMVVLCGYAAANQYSGPSWDLLIPYIPYLRMDRQVGPNPPMKLGMLDYLGTLSPAFDIHTLDPHSPVPDWINVLNVSTYIDAVIREVMPDVLCFPDQGAKDRYYNGYRYLPVICGEKKRNKETGMIETIDIKIDTNIANKKVLIIDDIISYGGTINGIAKHLEGYNPAEVYVYATHIENSFWKGTLYKSPNINGFFCTDSIQEISKDKLTILPVKI